MKILEKIGNMLINFFSPFIFRKKIIEIYNKNVINGFEIDSKNIKTDFKIVIQKINGKK